MKKITSFFLVLFFAAGFAYGQNSSGGANFYQSLFGDQIAPLGAPGGTALVWVDMAHENDGVVDGLTNLGYSVTVALNASDFNTQLQNGHFTLAVLFTQNNTSTYLGISQSILANYISGGGSAIYATWDVEDEAFANLFDAHITGNANMVTVTITDPLLASGITNPFTLQNIYWGTYSLGLAPINSAEVLATFENSDAAIIRGNGGRTIMLGYLSDASPVTQRQAIFENVVDVTVQSVVPFPYYWIIILFVLLAAGVVFAKRKVIFS